MGWRGAGAIAQVSLSEYLPRIFTGLTSRGSDGLSHGFNQHKGGNNQTFKSNGVVAIPLAELVGIGF